MVCSVKEVMDATGAWLHAGDANVSVGGVSTDTRTLERGNLFVALRGPNFDGNRFAHTAREAGAAALLLNPDMDGVDLGGECTVVLHPEPRRAMGDLAAWHRSLIPAKVVGVTGSAGKTTTKDILIQLLESRVRTVGSPSSFNNDVGVPLTLFGASRDTEAVVVEIGTSAPGEIARLCRIARPTVGIITNIGPSHLEFLGDEAGVAREKGELGAALPRDGMLVIPAHSPHTRQLRSHTSARVCTVSVDGEGDLNASEVRVHEAGTDFLLNGREVSSPLFGTHNVHNLTAALAACTGLGFSLDEVLPAVAHLRGSRQRLQQRRIGTLHVLDDTYNANPLSSSAALEVLAGRTGGRRIAVLGDMLELGPSAAEHHHALGMLAAKLGIDELILVGELSRATAAGALEGGLPAERVLHLDSLSGALEAVPQRVRGGDSVLLKASRGMRMESLLGALQAEFGEEQR